MRPVHAANHDIDSQVRSRLMEKIQNGAPLHGPPLSARQMAGKDEPLVGSEGDWQGKQPRLFDAPVQDEPWRSAPEDWVARGDVFFHGTSDPDFERALGPDAKYGRDVHFGTFIAADDRVTNKRSYIGPHARIVPLRLAGSHSPNLVKDYGDPQRPSAFRDHDASFYENRFEDSGTISGVADHKAVRTWAQDVKEAERQGKNVGPVRSQMAGRYWDLSYGTPEDDENTYTQGAMFARVQAPVGEPDVWRPLTSPDEGQQEFERYGMHGQRIYPTGDDPTFTRFDKQRY